MELSRTQESILFQLKVRGSQSVKILANRLKITTMGIRQHLNDLSHKGLIDRTKAEKQTRGRPVQHWRLSPSGHNRFPNNHQELAVDLINLVQEKISVEALDQLIDSRTVAIQSRYEEILAADHGDVGKLLETIKRLRTEDGYMAEIRILPEGDWLLIENHCPILAAAQNCPRICHSELLMFKKLFTNQAVVERTDFLLDGARRCAYKVIPIETH